MYRFSSGICRRRTTASNQADNLRVSNHSSYMPFFICFYCLRGMEFKNLCTLCDSSLDLVHEGSHISLSASVHNTNVFSTKTDSRTGSVHSHVTTADNDNIFPCKIRWISISDITQHLNSGNNTLSIFARNTKLLICMCTDRNINCIVVFF